MISTDQQYILDVGSQLTLSCEFQTDQFSLFDNPVQWKKVQHGEVSEINILGNIKEPFESDGRFSVTYRPSPPEHTLSLTILDMRPEDSANYTCEVRAPKSAPLGTVQHTVFVKDPVTSVRIVMDPIADPYENGTPSLTFIENEPTHLRCVAHGGSPPPELELSIDGRNYNGQFHFDTEANLLGSVGFRQIGIVTTISSNDFQVGLEEDGKTLTCIAKVPTLPKSISSALIVVNHAPRIECQKLSAKLGDRNVHLTCDVTARPDLTSWYWVLNDGGMTLSEGEVIDEYWTVVTKSNGLVHLKLYIREIILDSFRPYELHAENSVAAVSATVTLEREYGDHDSRANIGDEPKLEKHASERNVQNSCSRVSFGVTTGIIVLGMFSALSA